MLSICISAMGSECMITGAAYNGLDIRRLDGRVVGS